MIALPVEAIDSGLRIVDANGELVCRLPWGRSDATTKQIVDALNDAARYRFRHSNYKDSDGYEYGYCKVRWNNGAVESMLWFCAMVRLALPINHIEGTAMGALTEKIENHIKETNPHPDIATGLRLIARHVDARDNAQSDAPAETARTTGDDQMAGAKKDGTSGTGTAE